MTAATARDRAASHQQAAGGPPSTSDTWRYVAIGSQCGLSTDAEDQVLLSELARAELAAVFHRQLREHKQNRDECAAVLRQFSTDEQVGYWTWVPLDSGIVEHVVRTFTTLPEDVFLRTADCLHLVTVLRQGFTEIHTHDAHQRNGAGALGLATVTLG